VAAAWVTPYSFSCFAILLHLMHPNWGWIS
jgi:hypothetical protein